MHSDFEAVTQTFLAESEQGLLAMEEALVALEGRPDDEDLLQTIFRVTHTLKGNSASLGFPGIAEFAHVLEDLLDHLRSRTLPVTRSLVTLLLQSVDALRRMVPEAVAGTEGIAPEHRKLLKRLVKALKGPAAADAPLPPESAEEALSADRRRVAGRRRSDLERARTLRVDIDKLDQMLNLSGEIAVARGRFGQMLEGIAGHVGRELLEAHREADRLYMDLQEQVMKARMVPVGPMFRQHIRTVRDIAAVHGKVAQLVVEGEDVEVDTRVIEHLRDPLTHMVRNAVDHGIEPPETRTARGKISRGTITLRASHDAGSIVIEVEDDGAGLSRERIGERARSRGIVAEPEKLADAELFRLVLEPGFSTAAAVTELSGRGVGMDVVRRNIEALRGTLTIESQEGEGSTFTIRLPLTLAIIEGFGVGAGDETYVIPMEAVVECVALSAENTSRGERGGVLNLRGQPLPYLRLRDVFGLNATSPTPARENVVVVQCGDARAGLAVDVLLGESQTVIKALGPLFRGIPGVSGSAILGNGRVALILDVPSLFREALVRESESLSDARRMS